MRSNCQIEQCTIVTVPSKLLLHEAQSKTEVIQMWALTKVRQVPTDTSTLSMFLIIYFIFNYVYSSGAMGCRNNRMTHAEHQLQASGTFY